jgi:hypothetical protein
MRHPWTVPVLLALTALAGYAGGARPVQAQAEAFPFQVGDIVTFSFQGGGGSRPCRIEEMKGAFARCGSPDRQGPTIGGRKPLEEWVNVAVVEWAMRVREDK